MVSLCHVHHSIDRFLIWLVDILLRLLLGANRTHIVSTQDLLVRLDGGESTPARTVLMELRMLLWHAVSHHEIVVHGWVP